CVTFLYYGISFFFSSRRRHTRFSRDWSSDVCSSDLFCLVIYYGLPWLRWDRGPGAPDQALLLDMSGPRGYFFNIEIWPQEVYYRSEERRVGKEWRGRWGAER